MSDLNTLEFNSQLTVVSVTRPQHNETSNRFNRNASLVIEWRVDGWQLHETNDERRQGLQNPRGGWRADDLRFIPEAIDKLCLCPLCDLCKVCRGSKSDYLVRICVHPDKDGIIDKDIGACNGCNHRDVSSVGYHELHTVIPFTPYRYMKCDELYLAMLEMHKTYGYFNRYRWIFCIDVIFPSLYETTCDIPNRYDCTS